MTPHFLEHLRPQGSWQREGKLRIFCGLGEGAGEEVPQLPMYLSLRGKILANAGEGF